MQVLQVIGLFFIQPILWLGLLRSYLVGRRRINYERRMFGSAINAQNIELRTFFKIGLPLGLCGSIISVILGLTFDPVWAILYQVIAILSLVVIPTTLVPVTAYTLSWLIWQWLPVTGIQDWLKSLGISSLHTSQIANQGLWGLALVVVGTAVLILVSGGLHPTPRVVPDQRGKRIVHYPWQQLLVVPIVVLVPGNWFTSHWAFWPVFGHGQQTYTLLILPLLLGIGIKVIKQIPRAFYQKLGRSLMGIGLITVIVALINFWIQLPASLVMLVILCLIGLTFWQAHYRDRHQQFWFSDTDEGVRVIGIRPHTPATKMKIGLGDVILEVNRQTIHNETEFYEALLINPTYCHLKLRNTEGNLIITETAIFTGAPHELGIVLFTDQED